MSTEGTQPVCGKDHTYNGWTNYETWNVKLWIDNDEGTQGYWAEIALEAWTAAQTTAPDWGGQTAEDRARLSLMETLKATYQNEMSDVLEAGGNGATMWADLLGAALSEVNWYELAEGMIDEAKGEVTK